MPARITAAVLLLALAAAPLRAAATPRLASAADAPRVRPTDSESGRVLQQGLERSPTLRAAVERLARFDVVVYLTAARLPPHVDGQLTFLSSVAGIRYVLVEIAWDRTLLRRISTLGHELQHAIEIAENRRIVSAESLAGEYAQFGIGRDRLTPSIGRAYETAAAIGAGEQVWKEVTGAAADD